MTTTNGKPKSALKEQYDATIVPELKKLRGYGNTFDVPRLDKIIISTGIGTDQPQEMFAEAVTAFGEITGQRPVISKARVSIANFKLREGMPVGVFVTLRGRRMYDFLYRLINVAMPRVRDFRGLSPKSFDGFGNYSFGITDHTIFTEINLDKVKHTIGMNVAIVTTAKTNDEGRDLLSQLNMPFSKAKEGEF